MPKRRGRQKSYSDDSRPYPYRQCNTTSGILNCAKVFYSGEIYSRRYYRSMRNASHSNYNAIGRTLCYLVESPTVISVLLNVKHYLHIAIWYVLLVALLAIERGGDIQIARTNKRAIGICVNHDGAPSKCITRLRHLRWANSSRKVTPTNRRKRLQLNVTQRATLLEEHHR